MNDAPIVSKETLISLHQPIGNDPPNHEKVKELPKQEEWDIAKKIKDYKLQTLRLRYSTSVGYIIPFGKFIQLLNIGFNIAIIFSKRNVCRV